MNTAVIRPPTGGGSLFSVLLPNVIYVCCVTLCSSEGKSHDAISKRMGTAAMISYCTEIMGYLFNNVAIVLQGLICDISIHTTRFMQTIIAWQHMSAKTHCISYHLALNLATNPNSEITISSIYISNYILIILNNVCCATYTLVHDVIAKRIKIDIYDKHIFHCCLCESHDTNTPSCLVIGNYTKGMGCRFLSQLLILDNW